MNKPVQVVDDLDFLKDECPKCGRALEPEIDGQHWCTWCWLWVDLDSDQGKESRGEIAGTENHFIDSQERR